MSWVDAGSLVELPARGARVLRIGGIDIAIFRTGDGAVHALRDRCPHRGGPLSQGIVHGARVTCPLHDWVIDLQTGQATGADEGCTPVFAVRVEAERVLVDVPERRAERFAGAAEPVGAAEAAETSKITEAELAPFERA